MPNDSIQATCAERIKPSLERTLCDLRCFLETSPDKAEIKDNQLIIGDLAFDFNPEDYESTEIEEIYSDLEDEIRESCDTAFNEYGLAFDYVAPDTFTDQEQGYFRYQLSWGGPSTEFRYYVNPDLSAYRVEFWFLDWSDGASITLSGDDKTFMLDLYQTWFNDSGTCQHELDKVVDE